MAYNNWFSLVLRMVENQINFEVFQMDNAMNEANPREELTHTIRLKLLQRVAMQARGEYESLGYRHSLVVADSGSGAIPATDYRFGRRSWFGSQSHSPEPNGKT